MRKDEPNELSQFIYATDGQESGWHFDNSSFTITSMIENLTGGDKFAYVKDVRGVDQGELNYELSGKVLYGEAPTMSFATDAGALVLFRGSNSMHRVTPTVGDRIRMRVALACNSEPGVSLAGSARMTFYGRLEVSVDDNAIGLAALGATVTQIYLSK